MDTKLFEVLGKQAGLAGFSIGLILLIFYRIIKMNIFPKLNTSRPILFSNCLSFSRLPLAFLES
jgi:hypothetical protein